MAVQKEVDRLEAEDLLMVDRLLLMKNHVLVIGRLSPSLVRIKRQLWYL